MKPEPPRQCQALRILSGSLPEELCDALDKERDKPVVTEARPAVLGELHQGDRQPEWQEKTTQRSSTRHSNQCRNRSDI